MKHIIRRAAALLLCLLIALPVCRAAEAPRAMLTFDDGPSGRITQALLELLKEEQVPATFFLCGYRVVQFPELVAQMAAEGHEIGIHGWSHTMLDRLPPAQLRQELEQSIDIVTEITGLPVRLFRPPCGFLSSELVDAAARAGVKIVLWSVDPEDWRGKRAAQIAASVLTHASGDCVILLHDMKLETVEATRLVIHALRRQGYVFTAVPVS